MTETEGEMDVPNATSSAAAWPINSARRPSSTVPRRLCYRSPCQW